MAECNRRRALVADQPRQRGIVGVGPEMFVVVERIGVHDQELIFVLADAQREGQFAQPPEPPLAQIAPRPRHLSRLAAGELLGRSVVVEIAVLISAHAGRADLFQTL